MQDNFVYMQDKYTCILNYVYMQDHYVYMQDNQINFNFTDIMHLVRPIYVTGNGPCSSLNMRILTQLVIFAFWSILRPFF